MWYRSCLLVLAALCFPGVPPGIQLTQAHSEDHDSARRAVERGELRPLSEILATVEKEFDARVLEVELERDKKTGILIYEIKILARDGRVLELEYDGRTGKRMRIKEDKD